MSTNPAFIECQIGRAELKDVKACHVEAMVEYIYDQRHTPAYPAPPGDWPEDTIDFDVSMMVLTDQYNVVGLRTEPESRIQCGISDSVYNAAQFTVLVNKIIDNEDIPESILRYAVEQAAIRWRVSILKIRPSLSRRDRSLPWRFSRSWERSVV